MDPRRWVRRGVMLGLFAGTLAWIRVAGFAYNRRRAAQPCEWSEERGATR